MKKIKKKLFDSIVSMIIFTVVLIVLTIFVTNKFIELNIEKVYADGGLMIQINTKINKDLEDLSDAEGLGSKYNMINVTNNNNITKKYQIILTPINKDENDIRMALDDVLIRNLSKFEKQDNSYVVGEYSLLPNQTRMHSIRMWIDKNSQNKKINVNFKVNVKILD